MPSVHEDNLFLAYCERKPKELLFPVIRNIYPSQVANDFASVSPIVATTPIPTKRIQSIEIYDPREKMHRNTEENRVIIRRVVRTVPINKTEEYHLVLVETIETLREYTFEEWDLPLEKSPKKPPN